MRIVSEQQNRSPPTYKEQLACFVDGQFLNDSTREYWRAVSRLVATRSAMSCFLRYHQSYKETVARFPSPQRGRSGARLRRPSNGANE